MNAARRRNRRSPRRSVSHMTALIMRLPTPAAPVIRGVMRDPVRVGIVVSDAAGCAQCLAACRHLSVSLQALCQSLCTTVCNGRQ
jgi:hypothetical protein